MGLIAILIDAKRHSEMSTYGDLFGKEVNMFLINVTLIKAVMVRINLLEIVWAKRRNWAGMYQP